MTIRTIAITDVTAVDFDPEKTDPYFYLSEKFIWVKNRSPSVMYVSGSEIFDAGSDGVSEIPAGDCVRVNTPPANIIYLSGDGDAEIYTSDSAVCPFGGGSSSGGGSGTDDYNSLLNRPKFNGKPLARDPGMRFLHHARITEVE